MLDSIAIDFWTHEDECLDAKSEHALCIHDFRERCPEGGCNSFCVRERAAAEQKAKSPLIKRPAPEPIVVSNRKRVKPSDMRPETEAHYGWVGEPYKSAFLSRWGLIDLSMVIDLRSEANAQLANAKAIEAGFKYFISPTDSVMGNRLYVTRRGHSGRCIYAYEDDQIKKRVRVREKYQADLDTRVRQIVRSARVRANKRGIPFDLVEDDIVARWKRGVCEATGMRLNLGASDRDPMSPSLDQKNPGCGYTMDNVQITSWAYNRMKSDLPEKLFLEITTRIAKRIAKKEG